MKNLYKRLIFRHLMHSKRSAFFLIFLIPLLAQASPKIVRGYIISRNNDTLYSRLLVEADIFGDFNEIKLYHEVDLMNDSGTIQKFTPADINGFGFDYKDKQYAFISKPVDKGGKMLFVEPVLIGRKATLYLYKDLSYMTNEYHFTLVKMDGSFICLSDFSSLESLRQNLKSFFGEDKDAITMINSSFRSRSRIERDMTKVVREVNSDKKSLMASTQ